MCSCSILLFKTGKNNAVFHPGVELQRAGFPARADRAASGGGKQGRARQNRALPRCAEGFPACCSPHAVWRSIPGGCAASMERRLECRLPNPPKMPKCIRHAVRLLKPDCHRDRAREILLQRRGKSSQKVRSAIFPVREKRSVSRATSHKPLIAPPPSRCAGSPQI